MRRIYLRHGAAPLLAFGLLASPGITQSFDEGSFGTGTTTAPAQTQPAISNSGSNSGTSSGAGGFEDGSFDPNGNGQPNVIAPPQETTNVVPGGDDLPRNVIDPVVPRVDPVTPEPVDPVPNNNGGIDPQITAYEMRDFGVPPQNTLRQGQFHGHTPTAIPGGSLVTTGNLVGAIQNGTQMVIIDVLGSGYGLPNAYNAPALASGGSYNDRTQQQANQWLNQITSGNRDMPIVIYCSDPMCWLSYNASLRTLASGYTQVYWYRGGVSAWQMAGLPMQPSGF